MVYADSARANFFRPGGDHLTLLNVYNEVSCHRMFCSGSVTIRLVNTYIRTCSFVLCQVMRKKTEVLFYPYCYHHIYSLC